MRIRSLVRVGVTGASALALLASVSTASAHWAGVGSARPSSSSASASTVRPPSQRAFHSGRSAAQATDGIALDAPICTILGNGQPGAAAGMTPADNTDALNILAFGLSSDATTITAEIKVSNLTDGPNGGPNLVGTADDWYVSFTYKKNIYYLKANYGGATDTSSASVSQDLWNFYYGRWYYLAGTNNALLLQSEDDGDAIGHLDAAHGIITIQAPLSSFGTAFLPGQVEPVGPVPALGASVNTISAISYYEQGSPGLSGPLSQGFVNVSDTLAPDPKVSYKIGTSC